MEKEKYVWFSLMKNFGGYSFSSYIDRNGQIQGFELRKKSNGDPEYKRYTFTRERRKLRIPTRFATEIELIKNHPECEGSPNTRGITVFKLEEPQKAKADTVSHKKRVNEVMNKILKLDEKGLRDAAIKVSNCFSEDAAEQQYQLMEAVDRNPDAVEEAIDSRDIHYRSLCRRALQTGVFSKKGFMFYVGDEHIGNDEDSVVRKLMEDTEFYDSIVQNTEKAGG